ncbi:MAG TPA: TonB-dependent receptor [Vicinamibacterales bacterium]|nr:TonB-dependent receptor [Vicinamibacterales bacterium]
MGSTKRRVGWSGLVLAAVWLLAAPAGAQITGAGVLTGTVKDAQGAVLPGVTVTATSPSLIGTQISVSEANGAYRFPALPAGTYTLTFVLSGFRTTARTGIVLAVDQTLTIDMAMPLASVKENVTVTAESPIVDVQSTQVGNVLNTAKLISVPTSTDLWGALAQTPGIRMQGYDVGGSHKMQQTGYEAFGIRGQAQEYMDGIDTTSGASGDMNYMDYYAQDQLSVTAAGGDVTIDTPGAAIISTVKSGGNSFHGLENFTYEPGSFVGNNVTAAGQARGFTGQPNLEYWEGHVDLGGYLKKNKLWFYTAYNQFRINVAESGVPQNIATNLTIMKAFTNKETYKPTEKDTLIGFYEWNWKGEPLRGLSATVPKESALAEFSPSWNYSGRYQRVWNNRLFSEISYALSAFDFPEQPNVNYLTNPPRQDLVTGLNSGAGWGTGGGPFDTGIRKPQFYARATYFLPSRIGSHDLKAGFEWQDFGTTFDRTGTSGPILYLDANGQPSEIRLTDVGTPSQFGSTWTGPNDHDRRYSLYLQDRWTPSSKVTATLGVRYDRQRPYYDAAKTNPVLSDIFAARTVPGQTLLVRNDVMPRLGLAWDPGGNGRQVIKAFYGRFYFNFADAFTGVDPGGTQTRDYVFLNTAGDGLYHGPQDLGTLLASSGGVSTTIDPNIKTPYTDEVDLSYERQFWGESSFRVAYVRKMVRDQFATYNISREGQFTVPVTVTIPIQNYGTGVSGTQTFTVYDIPSTLSGVVNNVIATMPASVDYGAENYDTIEFAFNKRFKKNLFVDSDFDYEWRNELRAASSNNNPQAVDPITVGYFQNVYPTVPVRQKTTSWQAHLSGRYEFPYQIGLGVNLQVQSGWPWARIITVRLPNSGIQRFFMANLNSNYSDTVALMGLRVDKAVRLPFGKFTAMFDVFNLFNSSAVTNFNLGNGSLFNEINGALNPRTAEISVRFDF